MTELKEKFLKVKRELFDEYYSFLNERQREAVYTVNGPLLILAGAGSGKTTVLVNRIAHIIKYGNAFFSDYVRDDITEKDIENLENIKTLPKEEIEKALFQFSEFQAEPWSVLAITFTNKAAREISERLKSTLGEECSEQVWTGTFHSVCLRLLRMFGDEIGFDKRNITIYDTDDTKRMLKKCLKELDIDEKMLSEKLVMKEISRYKDKLLYPSDVAEMSKEFSRDAGKYRLIYPVYSLYQKKLTEANAVDFDDIIFKTVELLKTSSKAKEYCNKKFKYVSVDEYQDTNHAQFVLTSLLSEGYNNIMAVGDDDQSIYKFRGATIENILEFDKRFKNTRVIKLEQNYRSTSYILDSANAVIRHNTGRKGKELWTDKKGGEKVWLKTAETQVDEAKYIVNKISELVLNEKRSYSDFAVLCRMNAQSSTLESVFAKSGIPFRVLCGMRFYERKEVKDILSYLCLINNHNDDLRLKRIINEPKRKIGETTVNAIEKIATAEGCSMFEVINNCRNYTALGNSFSKLENFANLINHLTELSNTVSLSELTSKTISLTGYEQMLTDGEKEEEDRLENVRQLISNAEEYEDANPESGLSDYLEEVSLVADIDNYNKDDEAVTVMTIHSAKGLEFPVVFIPGLEDGIFPGEQSKYSEGETEEERRLCYVALTRAKQRLFLTNARERMMFGKTMMNLPSIFLREIPEEYIHSENEEKYKPRYRSEFIKRKPSLERLEINKSKPAVGNNLGQSKPREIFNVGDRVRHFSFGCGTVLSSNRMGADTLYEIAFDNVGTKKMMATYAKLSRE